MRFIYNLVTKYFILGIVCVCVYLFFSDFATLRLNTADSSIYLSTAENIVNHKGFVVSYNLCQCFNTLYHPIWAYYQPLYELFASLFINHGGIIQVIRINILIFAINVMLILYLIQKVSPTRFNFLFIFFLIFSFSFFLSALYAWTEQFYFLNFLVTLILFLRFKDQPKHLLWLGFLNGILMLIRVAHMYNFLAYLPVFFIGKAPLRQKFTQALYFAGGFMLFYGFYQLFCLFTYHAFYPEYARPGAAYGMAIAEGGTIYEYGKVGIQNSLGPFFSLKHMSNILFHIRDFYFQLPIFVWPALFYYFLPAKKRLGNGLIELCFLQSLFTILGYSVTFYWANSIAASRYSMIPEVLLSVAGWYCLYQGLSLSESTGKKVIGILLLLGFLYPHVNKFLAFKIKLFKNPPLEAPNYKDLLQGDEWIDKNLPKEILVASDQDQEGYFMHRPFISTPPGKAYNCTNLVLYNHIYSPDYYYISSALTDKCFTSIPYTTLFLNKTYRLLKVTKDGK